MLNLTPSSDEPLRILCLGAHSDDLEIGAGGTILSLANAYPDARVHWAVFSAGGARREEAHQSAEYFTSGYAEAAIESHEHRDGFFPSEFAELKERFEALKGFRPDLILTHSGKDRHQDHRCVSELTWQTFRDHLILEYEIPKYDGDLGAPGFFVALETDDCERKLDGLMRFFASQRSKRWFTRDTFSGLMRLRGVECNSASGFAEAFYTRKVVLK